MSKSVQAAIIKYHKLGGLTETYFLQFWRLAKIKVLSNSVPGESSLPSLQIAFFAVCSHNRARREREGEKEKQREKETERERVLEPFLSIMRALPHDII